MKFLTMIFILAGCATPLPQNQIRHNCEKLGADKNGPIYVCEEDKNEDMYQCMKTDEDERGEIYTCH
jgi:hypothetical protein